MTNKQSANNQTSKTSKTKLKKLVFNLIKKTKTFSKNKENIKHICLIIITLCFVKIALYGLSVNTDVYIPDVSFPDSMYIRGSVDADVSGYVNATVSGDVDADVSGNMEVEPRYGSGFKVYNF